MPCEEKGRKIKRVKISASLVLALAARTAAQHCADSAGTPLPLSAALPAPFACLSLALLILICLDYSFRVIRLGCGRSTGLVAHCALGKVTLSASFPPRTSPMTSTPQFSGII